LLILRCVENVLINTYPKDLIQESDDLLRGIFPIQSSTEEHGVPSVFRLSMTTQWILKNPTDPKSFCVWTELFLSDENQHLEAMGARWELIVEKIPRCLGRVYIGAEQILGIPTMTGIDTKNKTLHLRLVVPRGVIFNIKSLKYAFKSRHTIVVNSEKDGYQKNENHPRIVRMTSELRSDHGGLYTDKQKEESENITNNCKTTQQ
jgi:hypothetical protein